MIMVSPDLPSGLPVTFTLDYQEYVLQISWKVILRPHLKSKGNKPECTVKVGRMANVIDSLSIESLISTPFLFSWTSPFKWMTRASLGKFLARSTLLNVRFTTPTNAACASLPKLLMDGMRMWYSIARCPIERSIIRVVIRRGNVIDANVTGIGKISRSDVWRLVGQWIDWFLFLLTFICVWWGSSSMSESKCLSHRFDLRTSLCHDKRLCSLQSVPQPFVSRSSSHKMSILVSVNSMMSKINDDSSPLLTRTVINSSHAFKKRQLPIPSSCNRSQRIVILRKGCRRVLSLLSTIILVSSALAFGLFCLTVCRLLTTWQDRRDLTKLEQKREKVKWETGRKSISRSDRHLFSGCQPVISSSNGQIAKSHLSGWGRSCRLRYPSVKCHRQRSPSNCSLCFSLSFSLSLNPFMSHQFTKIRSRCLFSSLRLSLLVVPTRTQQRNALLSNWQSFQIKTTFFSNCCLCRRDERALPRNFPVSTTSVRDPRRTRWTFPFLF